MAHSMLYPTTTAASLAPWLERSVTDYFGAMIWEPLPPPLPSVTNPAAPPLTLSMSVVEYFANFPWGGSIAEDTTKLTALPDLAELSELADDPMFDELGLAALSLDAASLDAASLDAASSDAASLDAASSEQVSFEELFAARFDDVVEPDRTDSVPLSGPSLSDFSDFF